jgi:RHS repeat-associated protein
VTDASGITHVTTFTYDVEGRRTSQTTDGQTTLYLVDSSLPDYEIAEEYSPSGKIDVSYVYGVNLISQDNGGTTSYYLFDAHSGVRQLANLLGQVTDTYTYDAFGNLISQTGTTPNTHLYRGEVFDFATGLYDLRARYLDPATGRFLSEDSLNGDQSAPLTFNKFIYALDNPANNVDPTGQQSLTEVGVAESLSGSLDSTLRPPPLNLEGFVCYDWVLLNLDPTHDATQVRGNPAKLAKLLQTLKKQGYQEAPTFNGQQVTRSQLGDVVLFSNSLGVTAHVGIVRPSPGTVTSFVDGKGGGKPRIIVQPLGWYQKQSNADLQGTRPGVLDRLFLYTNLTGDVASIDSSQGGPQSLPWANIRVFRKPKPQGPDPSTIPGTDPGQIPFGSDQFQLFDIGPLPGLDLPK